MERQVMQVNRIKETIAKDDLLFHSVHGLCRVASVSPGAQSKESSYLLFPVPSNRAKARFTIPESLLVDSGFSKLISVKEANAILEYFKTGAKKASECGQAWTLASMIWSESLSKDPVKDTRKRQMLGRSVKGLAGEIAYVLKFTIKEVATKIQRNLGSPSKINPLVLTALANADDDE